MSNSVKRYRQFAGYTQQSIAKELNMPLSTYQQKEQGRINFSHSEMENIKLLLSKEIKNVTIDDIFFN
ncbi:XRE family transcriptional regulator [Apilactobacillus timberlakei]|uniref:XRE family transcriptional regulator n=1 Tax=Apilactobacillus timberlakei TaxID=2008380 RepID=A0ABY2YU32_9LACO|nr:XRE family transcriptional regulator [Apilactobacillus timberlakei]TPR15626.1 XRE family transcriptional regulator [Apilactobacillus timberlakei]